MTQFVELNFTEYSLDQNLLKIEPTGTNVCVCCLDHGGPFVNISSCTHTEFLKGIYHDTMDMSEMAVCRICHRMLAKIYLFKEQVEESLRKLNTQAENLTPNKMLNNLTSCTPITSIIDITTANVNVKEEINLLPESQVKTELDDGNSFDVFTNEDVFKNELTEIEILNDVPLKQESKPKKRVRKKHVDYSEKKRVVDSCERRKKKKSSGTPTFEEKYAGKINIIRFNNVTIMEERERDRAKEEYQKNLFKCEECVRSFEFEPSLIEHREKKHTYTEGSHQCDICKCYWDTERSLRYHQLCHFKRYECVKCGKRNRTRLAIIAHYDECHNETKEPAISEGSRRVCPECGLSEFKTDRSYRYHVEKHKGKAQCPHCDKVLANKNGLKTHLLTIHTKSPLEYTYVCKPCDKKYKTKMGLHVHKQIHHPTTPTIDKPEFCATCDRTFKNIKTLKSHLRWHSNHVSEDAKKYVCAHCGEKFLRKPELTEHVNWKHLKSTEHYCKLCDKAFKSDKILRTHNAFIHEKKTLPKNKICDHCGKGFSTSRLLRSHLIVHTRERPHKCDICEATFGHSAALYNHRRLVHKIRPKKDMES